MDREFRKLGLMPARLSPLDRLAYMGTRAMGALTYHPPADPEDADAQAVDLALLAHQAERILEGSAEDVLPELRVAGSCDVDLRRAKEIIGEVQDAVAQWPRWAEDVGVPAAVRRRVGKALAYTL